MSITVYSKPRCPQCDATYRKLNALGASYESIDVTQDEESLNLIKGLGYSQAPVVAVRGEGDAILGPGAGSAPTASRRWRHSSPPNPQPLNQETRKETAMQVFLTFVSLLIGVTALFMLGFATGRAFESKRIRKENSGDITAASTGGVVSDW